MIELVKKHLANEFDSLKRIFAFLAAFNRARSDAVNKQKPCIANRSTTFHDTPQNAMGDDALRYMCRYAVHQTFSYPNALPDEAVFLNNPLGAAIGKALAHWLQSLKWPVEQEPFLDDDPNKEVCKWGIPYLELFFNFYLLTGYRFPICIAGVGCT